MLNSHPLQLIGPPEQPRGADLFSARGNSLAAQQAVFVKQSKEISMPKKHNLTVSFRPIGTIHTPYTHSAPYQPVENDSGDFRVIVDTAYADGLQFIEKFSYIYLLYYIDRLERDVAMTVSPPWAEGKEVGLFASRSPVRPNPIGLSIVRLKSVHANELVTSGLDVFDGTPLLDIKPYIRDLDTKADANYGWLEAVEDHDHLMLHIKGIPHDY
jgi:tRNA-Thr(GGU) m(6)t(6)A37 methyltransferase TsaA